MTENIIQIIGFLIASIFCAWISMDKDTKFRAVFAFMSLFYFGVLVLLVYEALWQQ